MAFKKRTNVRGITPAGISIFPKLNTPDTKYKPLGEYATKLKFTAEEAQPLIEEFEADLAKYFEEVQEELKAEAERDPKNKAKTMAKLKGLKFAADKPYKPELDDEGEETGNIVFNYKMPARVAREGKPDLVLKPDFFDANGKKLAVAPEIWGGSKLAVAYELRPFNTNIGVGMSLRLQAVQIIELRQGGQRDAAGYGFGAVAGGYEASDEAPQSDDQGSSEDSGSEENPDF